MGAGNFVSNNTRAIPFRLPNTLANVVFTAKGYTQIIGIRLVNFSTSEPTVALMYRPVDAVTNFYIQNNYVMPVATSLWFPFDAFGVKEDDEIRVQASLANAVDVFVFIAEVPGRSA